MFRRVKDKFAYVSSVVHDGSRFQYLVRKTFDEDDKPALSVSVYIPDKVLETIFSFKNRTRRDKAFDMRKTHKKAAYALAIGLNQKDIVKAGELEEGDKFYCLNDPDGPVYTVVTVSTEFPDVIHALIAESVAIQWIMRCRAVVKVEK